MAAGLAGEHVADALHDRRRREVHHGRLAATHDVAARGDGGRRVLGGRVLHVARGGHHEARAADGRLLVRVVVLGARSLHRVDAGDGAVGDGGTGRVETEGGAVHGVHVGSLRFRFRGIPAA